jgi:hypothetical protein
LEDIIENSLHQEDNKMNYSSDMEFEIQKGFMPNFYNSQTLKIVEVNEKNLVIRMNNAVNRSVFPVDHFDFWIKRGLLVKISDQIRTS